VPCHHHPTTTDDVVLDMPVSPVDWEIMMTMHVVQVVTFMD
jgi:hypothetical protein